MHTSSSALPFGMTLWNLISFESFDYFVDAVVEQDLVRIRKLCQDFKKSGSSRVWGLSLVTNVNLNLSPINLNKRLPPLYALALFLSHEDRDWFRQKYGFTLRLQDVSDVQSYKKSVFGRDSKITGGRKPDFGFYDWQETWRSRLSWNETKWNLLK